MIIHLLCNNCEKCIPYISTPQHENKIAYHGWFYPKQDTRQTMWVYDEILENTYTTWKVAVEKIQGTFVNLKYNAN